MSETALAVFESHRRLLFAVAHRMLGRAADAEDAVQETWLRWSRREPGSVEQPKPYLTAIVTRLCLDQLGSARARRERTTPAPEESAVPEDTAPDAAAEAELADSLGVAFLAMLERLAPVERAVFLLREVFEFEHAEIAAILGRSEAGCRQVLARARRHLAAQRRRFRSDPAAARRLAQRFGDACRAGDTAALLELLAPGVSLSVSGSGRDTRYGGARELGRALEGAETVARFLTAVQSQAPASMRYAVGELEGMPALLVYDGARPHSGLCLDVEAGRIREILLVSQPRALAAARGGPTA